MLQPADVLKKCLILLCALALSECSSPVSGSLPADHMTNALAPQQTRASTSKHLYVSDAGQHAVLRFALHGGTPDQRPDATIGGFSDPRGIAIGPDNRLYAIDAATRKLLIFAPKPGSASKPIASIALNHRAGLNTVTVDPLGYVYVGWEAVCTTEGFFCGYVDVYSPFDKGLHIVNSTQLGLGGAVSGAQVRGLAVNDAQLMAEDFDIGPPFVYTHAPFFKVFYTMFCGGSNDSGVAWGPSRVLYATDLGGSSPAQVVVITKIVSGCPTFYTITSATTPLNRPLAIAAGEGRIYVTSAFDQQLGSALVFVFNPAVAGSQNPLALIAGSASKLLDPRGLAIGL
ncbi:MAG: hypothetical protein M3M96_02900 [Candidatus Eremiobacteraeota bacterium]|nr:hypothetical protein [Candidatus Eremiobacteraeota bacterium]